MTRARSLSPAKCLALLPGLFLGFALLACSGPAASQAGGTLSTINAEALHLRLQQEGPKPLLVDVRESYEFSNGHIEGATLAPLATTVKALEDVEKDREIVLVCRSGRRSGEAQEALLSRGFTNAKNMEGGMIAWEKLGYPVVK